MAIPPVIKILPVIFGIAACSLCRAASGPQPQLVGPELTLSVDPTTNTASGLIHLSNPTDKQIPLSLSADDFKNSTSAYGLNTKTVFALQPPSGTPAPGQQVLETKLEPSTTIAVKVDVSNFWEAGEATANLRNYGEPIVDGKLRATKWRPPFAVKIVAPVPDKPEFTFTKGKKRQITLKNEDAMTYLVAVTAEVDGIWSAASKVEVPPSSSVPVELTPPEDWFPGSAGVKESVRDGNIRLRWQVANAGGQPVPERIIPFKAHLNSLGDFWQAVWGYAFVLVCLTLGGVCSMVLNNWVPNRLSRADIEEQLSDLARKTTGLSSRIDSGLRVFLRVERNRLHRLLRSRWIFSANFPDVVKQCSDKITVLGSQIDLARQLDRAREALEPFLHCEPIPVKIDEIDRDLQKAADLLRRCDCIAEDFDTAKTNILGATDRIGKMDKIDQAVADKLTARIKSLKSYLEVTPEPPARQELKKLFPKLFESFDPSAADNLEPTKYSSVDFVTARLELICRYQEYYDAKLPSPSFPRRVEGEKYFQTNTITGLRRASLLLREIREEVYVEGIEEAIAKKKARIAVEPAPVEDQLLKFSVRFDSEEFKEAAAREELRCEWDFGHNPGGLPGSANLKGNPGGAPGSANVKETPDGAPSSANVQETPDGAPSSANVKETPDGVPGLANVKETPDGAPGLANVKETPDGAPGSANVKEAPCEVPSVDNLTETGWEAFHYFPPPWRGFWGSLWQFLRGFWPWRKRASTPYRITARFSKRFPDPDDPPLLVLQEDIMVSEPPRSGGSDRNLAEGVRLGIALIIALIGLLAGAQEQLTKLDLIPAAIAVFLLGFGADTIKNLISPKQATPAPKPPPAT